MQKIVTSSNGNSRFHILDASRFFAAISVVLFHFLFLSWSGNHTNSISFNVIGEFFKYGYLGVQFFFLISGFVIFMSIQRGGVIDFLASRAARLYPAYWFAVLLTSFFIFFIEKNTRGLQAFDIFANLTMLQKFFGIKNIDGVYWTLAIELIFYFWMACLLAFKSITKFELAAFVFLTISFLSKVISFPSIVNLVFLTEYSPYFISGALFYLVTQSGPTTTRVSLIIASFLLAQHQAIFLQLPKIQSQHASPFSETSVALIVTSFFLFFSVIKLNGLPRPSSKIYAFMGALTYPLYLIHQEIGYIIINMLSGKLDKYALVLFTLIICLVISALIYLFIEKRYSKAFRKYVTHACTLFYKKVHLSKSSNTA
ncbi:putative acyltransferase [Pseudomonas sp. GM49]|uniref:acyltransferase family protein n=1 Tax=Pseudomonas sp. GM49 TaxID=1144331 RepID=UPI00026FF5A6|nr:acyltransferase [Pseudomonas sp. GM49]EJM61947.1 putative acyltransferase [Pseudomonas sp. GM49]